MSPRLWPNETERGDLPHAENPNGTRIFRVTDRQIDERTQLVMAHSPEEAIADDASVITQLARHHVHEVVECIELVPQGKVWQSAPEVS